MGIDNFTNRQLDFMIRYIGNLAECLKTLMDKRSNEKNMKLIGTSIQNQLGLFNEKELNKFTLFTVSGISTEETLAIVNHLNIINHSIIPTNERSKICAIRDDDYMKFCECCDAIKRGEIDLDSLVEKFNEKQRESYLDKGMIKSDSTEDLDTILNEEISLDEDEMSLLYNLDKKSTEEIKSDEMNTINEEKSLEEDIIFNDDDNFQEISEEPVEITNDNDLSEEIVETTNDNDFQEIEEESVNNIITGEVDKKEDNSVTEEFKNYEEDYNKESEVITLDELKEVIEKTNTEENPTNFEYDENTDASTTKSTDYNENQNSSTSFENTETHDNNDIGTSENKDDYSIKDNSEITKEEYQKSDDSIFSNNNNDYNDKSHVSSHNSNYYKENDNISNLNAASPSEKVSSQQDFNKTSSTYEDNFKKEAQQQQEIVNWQLEQRTAKETANVTHVGNGSAIKQTFQDTNTYHSNNIQEFKGIDGNIYNTSQQKKTAAPKEYDILVNQVSLTHGFNTEVSKKIINSSGEFIAAPLALGVLDTTVYTGRKEVKGLSDMFCASLSKASTEAAINSRLNKYQANLDNRNLKTFDTFIQNKGFSPLNYRDLKSGRESMESIYRTLEGSGLARFNAKTKTYDHSNFDKLLKSYKAGDKTALIKALKFSDKTPVMDIELVIGQLDKKIRDNKAHNLMNDKKTKTTKKSLKTKGKKLLQKNAVFDGYQEVSQTVTTLRTAYTVFKMSGASLKNGYRTAYKRVGNRLGKNIKFVQKRVDKKVNKWNQKDQQKRDKIGGKANRKREKINKKEVKKSVRRDETKKKLENVAKSIVGRNNYERTKRTGRRLINGHKKRIEKIKRSKVYAVFNKLNVFKNGIKNKILKIVNPISHFVNLIKAKLVYILGILGLGYIILMGGLMVVGLFITSVFDFFDTNSSDMMGGVSQTEVGRMVDKLIELESRWAEELSDEDKLSKVKLSNLVYTSDYVEIDEYSKQMDYNYDSDLDAIQSVEPFGAIITKNDFRKWLNKIDGGIEIVYKNASGGTTRTCNIKEIISMAAVYFENNTDFENEEAMSNEEYSNMFTGFFKKLSVMSQSENSQKNTISNYCINLFNISHRESYELENIIMPTKLTLENASNDSGIPVEGSAIKMCPSEEFKGYGCKQYENFYYKEDGIISISDINNALQDVKKWSYPKEKDTCVITDSGELEYQITDFRECYSISVSRTGEGGSASGCGGNLEEAVKEANGDVKSVSPFWVNGINSASAFAISNDKTRQVKNPGYDPNLPDGYGNNKYKTEIYHDNYTVTINRTCSGCHTAYYCAGHLKGLVTGNIYGFTDEQIEDESGDAIIGKVAGGEYIHKKVSNLTIDKNKLSNLSDIFDCDNALIHPSESKVWDGWIEENMELAIIKYQQDWEEWYGITINSSLGGEGLSSEDIKMILEGIESQYPNLSEERMAVIQRAMSYVGNIGYSQKHHPCPLDGPCRLNKKSKCGLSDCSGFISDLWSSRLGMIHTTYSFKSTYKSVMKPFNANTAIPGDIALHYGVNSVGEVNNHAVLYVGTFKYKGQVMPWTIDCTSINGSGNVFFRSYFRLKTSLSINADQL